MVTEVIDTTIIAPNLSSYQGVFDHAWAHRIGEVTDGTPLEQAVISVILAWRSTNGAHILPWLMTESAKQFSQGSLNGSRSFRDKYMDSVIN